MKLDTTSKLKNKKTAITVSTLILLIAAFGIGMLANSSTSHSSPHEYRDTTVQAGLGADLGGDSGSYEERDRKKATSIDIEIGAKDVLKAEKEITSLVEQSNGYITSSSIDREDSLSGSITAKVPSSNSSSFISEIEKVGKIESRRTNVDDVTDRYSELEAELESKKQELNRLRELLNQTETVSDLIEVEERISKVSSRIDYLEDRKARLDRRVEYTEVRIDISEPTPFNTGFEPRETLSTAYKGFFNSLTILIVGLGYLLPLALVGLLAYIGLKAWRTISEPN